MISQRDDEVLMIFTPFSRRCLNAPEGIDIYRPNLIAYINLYKVLDNYMSRCECTVGDWRGEIEL